jgi:internalin A
MGRREWIVLALFVVAMGGIGIAIALNRSEPGVSRSTAEADEELLRRMLGDPNKTVEDQTLIEVTRLGGEVVRQKGHEVFQPVIEVSFRDRPVTDEDLSTLGGLIHLRKIDLSGTKVTDAGLRALLAFRYLDSLNLARTEVTGKGLADLSPLTLINHVVLAGSKVTDMGLAGLVGVPKVIDLDLSDTAITNRALDRIKALPRLGTLNLARTQVTGSAAAEIRDLGLVEVNMTGIPLSAEEYLTLVRARPRKESDGPPPGGPIPVAAQPTILKLLGARPAISDEVLKALGKRGELDLLVIVTGRIVDPELPDSEDIEDDQSHQAVLDLSGSKVTDDGLTVLKDFREYLVLNLTGTKVGDVGLALPGDNRLRALHLDDTGVTNAGLPHLQRFDKMTILGLRRTKVTDDGLKQLGNMKSLRRLYLEGTAITDVGLKHLQVLPKLRVLDLRNTKVTDAGVAELKALLPMCAIKR